MSLLDDVRRLAEGDPCHGSMCERTDRCVFCDGPPAGDLFAGTLRTEHAPTCAWLALPRLAAALEAAKALADPLNILVHDPLNEAPDVHVVLCPVCGQEAVCDCDIAEEGRAVWGGALRRTWDRIAHAVDCDWLALLAALGRDT